MGRPKKRSLEEFRQKYSFLSNFYPCQVKFSGLVYPSVEHAFQAAKSMNYYDRRIIQNLPSPELAKKVGRSGDCREDWEEIKVLIMDKLIKRKFEDPTLREMLIATYPKELVEKNYWGDKFWGVYKGEGENWLGRILMDLREDLIEDFG